MISKQILKAVIAGIYLAFHAENDASVDFRNILRADFQCTVLELEPAVDRDGARQREQDAGATESKPDRVCLVLIRPQGHDRAIACDKLSFGSSKNVPVTRSYALAVKLRQNRKSQVQVCLGRKTDCE